MRELVIKGQTSHRDVTLQTVQQAIRKVFPKLKIYAVSLTEEFSGIPFPHFTPVQRALFHCAFKHTQGPFYRCKPLNRHNYLNYDWALFKVIHLFGVGDQWLYVYFHPLKGENKNEEHDFIWKEMCKDPEMQWTFYQTKTREDVIALQRKKRAEVLRQQRYVAHRSWPSSTTTAITTTPTTEMDIVEMSFPNSNTDRSAQRDIEEDEVNAACTSLHQQTSRASAKRFCSSE